MTECLRYLPDAKVFEPPIVVDACDCPRFLIGCQVLRNFFDDHESLLEVPVVQGDTLCLPVNPGFRKRFGYVPPGEPEGCPEPIVKVHRKVQARIKVPQGFVHLPPEEDGRLGEVVHAPEVRVDIQGACTDRVFVSSILIDVNDIPIHEVDIRVFPEVLDDPLHCIREVEVIGVEVREDIPLCHAKALVNGIGLAIVGFGDRADTI